MQILLFLLLKKLRTIAEVCALNYTEILVIWFAEQIFITVFCAFVLFNT